MVTKFTVINCPHCGMSLGTMAVKACNCHFCHKAINLQNPRVKKLIAKDRKDCAEMVRKHNQKKAGMRY